MIFYLKCQAVLVFNPNDAFKTFHSRRSVEICADGHIGADNVNAAFLEAAQRHQLRVCVLNF